MLEVQNEYLVMRQEPLSFAALDVSIPNLGFIFVDSRSATYQTINTTT
jgi:hypothetical protein